MSAEDKPLNRKCRRCIAHGKMPKRCGAENCKAYKRKVAKEAAVDLQITRQFFEELY